jgi:hypothetical protein
MKSHDAARNKLKAFGLTYPEAHSKSPWPDHDDLAVRDKTFAYLGRSGEPLTISCKLPLSGQMALTLPFTSPTGYGLGKSGWVTATFAPATSRPSSSSRIGSTRAIAHRHRRRWLPDCRPTLAGLRPRLRSGGRSLSHVPSWKSSGRMSHNRGAHRPVVGTPETQEKTMKPRLPSDLDAAASFAPLRPRLMRIAYRMSGSIADAEDVVQDAFLRWLGAPAGSLSASRRLPLPRPS